MADISLCVITQNEERNIERCLKSAEECADEIIIADTGSADRTKALCSRYGAKVYDYTWEDDFGKVREFCVSKASCRWVLLLDADEELQVRDAGRLKRYLDESRDDIIRVRMTHFTGGAPESVRRARLSSEPRLLRNDGKIRFSGRIHEKPEAGGKRVAAEPVSGGTARILHYGYMNGGLRQKAARNTALIAKEAEECPGNPRLDYYLAAEKYNSGEIAEAYILVNSAIARYLVEGAIPPPDVYKLKYDMLIGSREYKMVINGVYSACSIYPDYVDLHYYKGEALYHTGRYGEAAEAFSYCLTLGDGNWAYLIQAGSGSFLAMRYLGLCYERQGRTAEALEAFRQERAMV